MELDNLISIGVYAGTALAVILIIAFTITRLYHRATKEIGFVRTGFTVSGW